MLSNGVPIYNYVEKTFRLGKCGGKINTEVSVSDFFNDLLLEFYWHSFRILVENEKI